MPSPATSTDLWDLVEKSGLRHAAELAAYREALGPEAAEDDPPRLAARFVRDGLLTDFQAQQLLKGRFRHFIIGKYRVLEPLGVGGMSKVVFLCEHVSMGHRVAMKLLPLGPTEDPALVGRFQREARAVAALNHPNIVRAHDIDRDGDRLYYLIMDYVDGVSLHDLVRNRGVLEAERAAYYIAQTADGLQHVHEAGLVHRDVKPGNLLLDRAGVVKILDLGLARFLNDPTDELTLKYDDRAVLGTADYLSPEQALRSSEVDIRADIYSLGATFYFLLTGRAPFEDEKNIAQKLLSHQMHEPYPLAELRPDLPAELVAVVERMMAKHPDDRFQSPTEVIDALGPWIAEPPQPPDGDDLPRRGTVHGSGPRSRAPRSAGPATPASYCETAETLPQRGKRVRPTPHPVAASAGRRLSRKSLVLGGGVALAAALGIGLWLWSPWSAPKMAAPIAAHPTAAPTNAPGTLVRELPPEDPIDPKQRAVAVPAIPADALVVSLEPGPNRFLTIKEALAKARPGGRILVLNRPHAEQLEIGPDAPAGVTIEGWPGEPAVPWRRPDGGTASLPLVHLKGCADVRLVGFQFEGLHKVDDLVQVSGLCAGAALERVQFHSFNRSAVRFAGDGPTGGSAAKPLRIDSARVVAAKDTPAGIAFDAPAGSRNVQVINSRFEGPLAGAVAVAGPTTDVEVRHNRVFAAGAALRIRQAPRPVALRLTFTGNTVCQADSGIHFESLPAATGGRLTVLNNLFVATKQLASVEGLSLRPEGSAAQWVWHDEGGAGPTVPAATRYFRKAFDLDAAPPGAVTLDVGGDESFAVWVNGVLVGRSVRPYFTQRVHAIDVGKLLRPGRNVVAVECTNRTDTIYPDRDTPAGLLVQVIDRSNPPGRVLAWSDDTWKTSADNVANWQTPEFDDAAWTAARPWSGDDAWPWARAVWDSEVRPQLAAKGWSPPALVSAGNVRDEASWEGFPLLDSSRGTVEDASFRLSRDVADEGTFLSYPVNHPLSRAGDKGQPVGAPPR